MSEQPDAPAGSAPKSRHRAKLLMMAGVIIAVILLAGGVYASGILGGRKPVTKGTASLPTAAGSRSASEQAVFAETPEMITNLDAGPHRLSFVKVQCKIELAHAAQLSLLNASMPRLIDLIQTYLRETRPEELRSDTGTYRLREALLSRTAIAAPEVQVKDVLFEELIVQ